MLISSKYNMSQANILGTLICRHSMYRKTLRKPYSERKEVNTRQSISQAVCKDDTYSPPVH